MNEVPNQQPGEQEKMPEIKFDILFSTHESSEEARNLKDKIEQCDIYAPEFILQRSTTDEIEKELNDLSTGAINLNDYMMFHELRNGRAHKGFTRSVLEAIYDSKKTILCFDIDKADVDEIFRTNPELKRKQEFFQQTKGYMECLEIGDVDEAISALRSQIELIVALDIKTREEFILKKLKERLADLLDKNEALRNKDTLNVFISFGSMHTTLGHALRAEGFKVATDFNEMPYVYPYSAEWARRIMFGKEIPEDLPIKALAASVISGVFKSVGQTNTEKNSGVIRNYLSKLSVTEVEDFLKNLNIDNSRVWMKRIYDMVVGSTNGSTR